MNYPAAIMSFCAVLLAGCANLPAEKSTDKKQIIFDGNVPFAHEKSIKKEVREECNLNKNLSNSIIEKSKEHGIYLSNKSVSQRKLSVEIASATPGVFVFGNFGSVPAVLNVFFKVTEGDKVILEKRHECTTKLAGFMGLQPSACNKLNKCAENQAEFIARRLEELQ